MLDRLDYVRMVTDHKVRAGVHGRMSDLALAR